MDEDDLYLYGDVSTTAQSEQIQTTVSSESISNIDTTAKTENLSTQEPGNSQADISKKSEEEQNNDKPPEAENKEVDESDESEEEEEDSDSEDDVMFVLDVNQEGDKPKEEEALVNLKPEQTKTTETETVKAPAIDINVTAQFNGESLLDLDLDGLEEQPWRKPGADITDYFNYGFNEVTWRAYCNKQKSMREDLKKSKGGNHMDQQNGIPPIKKMDISFHKGPMDPSMQFIPPPGAPPFPPMPMLPPGMRPPMFHPQNRPHFDHGHGQINKHGANNGRDQKDTDRSPMRPGNHPRPNNRDMAKPNSPSGSRDNRQANRDNRDRNWDGNRERGRERDRDRDRDAHRDRERERDRSINTRSDRGRSGRGRDFDSDRNSRRRDSPEGLTTRDRKRQTEELNDRSYKRR